jgi:hypothetical protein
MSILVFLDIFLFSLSSKKTGNKGQTWSLTNRSFSFRKATREDVMTSQNTTSNVIGEKYFLSGDFIGQFTVK